MKTGEPDDWARTIAFRKVLRKRVDNILYREQVQRYRRLRRQAAISPKEWEALKKRYKYRCVRCGRREPHIRLTQDHIEPIIYGGTGNIQNVQPLCGKCNSKKGKSSDDYRASLQVGRNKRLKPR
jgi:5-methylcytosine-specific restriction endonuclease McrA